MAEVVPQETLTRDLIVLSFSITSGLVTIIGCMLPEEPLPLEYEDSYLRVLSDPSGWPGTLNLYVPIPAVVVPSPTIFVLTTNAEFLSLIQSNEIVPDSTFVVNIPTLLKPLLLNETSKTSPYISEIYVLSPS